MEEFVPPNPKEFDRKQLISLSKVFDTILMSFVNSSCRWDELNSNNFELFHASRRPNSTRHKEFTLATTIANYNDIIIDDLGMPISKFYISFFSFPQVPILNLG